MEKRVVVTGCGLLSCLGIGKEKNLKALSEGRNAIGNIELFDASLFTSRIAGEVRDYDPASYFSTKDARKLARFVQFAIVAAQEAVEESGLDLAQEDPYKAGVIIGSGIGSLQTIEQQFRIYLERGPSRLSPFLIPLLITNAAAGQVAIRFGCKGINFCTVTACASGAHALGESFRLIKGGEVDVMIAGGTEACITILGVGGFCALKALSTRNDEPKRASRPFDKDRDGFVIAEGAGIVVLEELEHARKRKAPIYAEVCGYGANCDAYHITAPDPEGLSAAKAIQMAMKEAKVDSKDIDYINAHGTSTLLNDKMETGAIKLALGNHARKVSISSTKSMTGHMLGAAGSSEFIFCSLAIKNGLVFPTINLENPDPACDLDYTPNAARKKNIRYAFSNSLGFGGHNATLVLKKFEG